jgi:AcrR family transcriptional regulator
MPPFSRTPEGSGDDPVLEGPPAGRDELGRERVSEIQRARILAAMVEMVSERGAANTRVVHVVARSGVSRRTFYELFEDREDCFLAAFEEGIALIANDVVPAYERPGRWRERIRASLLALLRFLDHDPGIARLVVVESLGAGAGALEHRSRVLAQVIAAVEEGRSEAKAGADPPPLTAEGVVGAAVSMVHTRLLEDGRTPLVEFVNPLMALIVLPYLGAAASARELARPAPAKRMIAVRERLPTARSRPRPPQAPSTR